MPSRLIVQYMTWKESLKRPAAFDKDTKIQNSISNVRRQLDPVIKAPKIFDDDDLEHKLDVSNDPVEIDYELNPKYVSARVRLSNLELGHDTPHHRA